MLLVIGSDTAVPALAEGVVLAIRTLYGEIRRIQVAAVIDPQAGGSPVVDEHGLVIGVVRAQVRDLRLLNFTIPVEAISKLLTNAAAKPVPLLAGHKVGDNADPDVFLSPEWKRTMAARESENWPAVLDAAQALARRFPGYAEAFACIGTAAMALKSYDNAAAAYRHALQLDPEYAYAWVGLGINYLEQGRATEAIAAYRQAIKVQPDSALPWSKLGELYCQQEKFDDAIATYRQMTQFFPDNPSGWANLGVSFEGQGKLDDAAVAYRRAVQLEPDYPFVWIRLGVVRGQLGQHDEARAAHRRAIELKPDFPMAWLSLDIGSIVRTNGVAIDHQSGW